jgi:2-polyprenyl-3-methyl-5-hydroxy-6-metoxy-1,4-benzoquinol methylase
VLQKYPVRYFRCPACGFIQTETPYWLAEAYSSAIAKQDVGIMQRNLLNRELTTAVLNLLLPEVKHCVDYGAGHGIFVRLMRDRGFDFRWYDRHATNDYARGFEYEPGQSCEFVTAFEVLEHLTDPVADLAEIMSISENVFVSTLLVPEPAPKLPDWWYFLPSTGQHISFYTAESLQVLAKRFDRHLLSHGAHHLFTKRPRNKTMFRMATRAKAARVFNLLVQRKGSIEADFEKMTR